MARIIKERIKICIICAIGLGLILIVYGGCKGPARIFTIGVAGHNIIDTESWEGFKAGMAELGYIEGENIEYDYRYIPSLEEQVIYNEIKELLVRGIDLILVKENEVALQAKKLVEGSDTPVLIMDSILPVEYGLVESVRYPGGNLTGTRIMDIIPKSLEWLAMMVPKAKRIYLIFNPDDPVSREPLPRLEEVASRMGIELVYHKIHSIEETVASIENLPEDIGAVFLAPSPPFILGNDDIFQAAIKRRIPLGTSVIGSRQFLMSFHTDTFNSGKNAARIAKRILEGTKPANIPVEPSEVMLTINLKTAEEIGFRVPDDVLTRADVIIR